MAHFTPVTLANQVSLDYDQLNDLEPHHYAFRVSEEGFDAALARIRHGGITHYGDPAHGNPHPGPRRVVRPVAAQRIMASPVAGSRS